MKCDPLLVPQATAPVQPDESGLGPLLQSPVQLMQGAGVQVGTLLALRDQGRTPLVSLGDRPGEPPLAARTVVDLHGAHVGASVVLVFEQGDLVRPIVMGVLRGQTAWPLPEQPGAVELDADGERMVVTAHTQLVLRCGQSSLTLRSDGRIELKGETVLSEAQGVHRIRGGSVQLN